MCPRSGHTMWSGLFDRPVDDALIAWDWIEVGRGIIAMVDPMRVRTNMRFLDRDGDELTAIKAALLINQFVRRLRWQSEVVRLIRAV